MSLTLFLNTFASQTRVKLGILRSYNDTALSRWPSSLYGESILYLALQNTLTKTPVRHFPIIHEAVTNTFMLGTNHRNTPQPFSRPYTSINLRYTTTCKSPDGVVIRVTEWMCFNDNKITYSYDKNNV
jgi:hypothetical protein